LELGARSQEPGGKRKKEGARRSVFTNMRCSRKREKEEVRGKKEKLLIINY